MWRVLTMGRGVAIRRFATAASQCSLPRWTCTTSTPGISARQRRRSRPSDTGRAPAAHHSRGPRATRGGAAGRRGGPPWGAGAAGLARARGNEGKTVGGGEPRRGVGVPIAREDHVTAEPELGHHLLESRARLPFSDEEQTRAWHRADQEAEALKQELVAAIGRQPRDRRDDRRIAELELLADRRPIRVRGEPRQVDRARNPEDPLSRNADLAAPRLDHPGHREHRGGAAIESRAEPVASD